jgi:tetratricopeptide (TPR) repeat protein
MPPIMVTTPHPLGVGRSRLDRGPSRALRLGRPSPAFGFVAALTLLASVGVGHLVAPERSLEGIPDDPGLAQARRLMAGRLPNAAGGLRFQTALAGEAVVADQDPGALAQAEEWARSALARRPDDVRTQCAVAAFDLARQRYERAERRYRALCDRVPGYGEARLGLGMALARQAEATGQEARARRLTLAAIAQFAAVSPEDPVYLAALYDRALLLRRAGREAEARRWARAYLALDPGSAWARSLDTGLAQDRPGRGAR